VTTYRNTGKSEVVFRDDSPEKRFIAPGETFTLVGSQHAPVVEALEGVEAVADPEPIAPDATVEELRAAADKLNIRVPANAKKAELREAVVAVTGEVEGEPV
jgi:hypothetical protein